MYQQLSAVWNQLTQAGSPFAVHEISVRGSPVRCYVHAPPSLREIWLGSVAHAERDYLVFQDYRCTYGEAHRIAASVARWLSDQGVGPGDRVAIAMRNYPEWMLAYWATVSIGAVVVGMNAWWVTDEMAYALRDAAPRVLIADAERLERFAPLRSAFPDLVCVAVRVAAPAGSIAWETLLAAPSDMPSVSIDPDDDACIFYTSGTTGRPKGAQLTHRGCVNNVLNIAFINVVQSTALALAQGQPPASPAAASPGAALVCTPLFHVTANNCVAHASTLTGGKLVHLYRWDPAEALRLIEEEGITHFSGVPMMARELILHPDFALRDTSSLQAIGGGGAALQPDLVGKLDAAVATARPSTGYGMTEVCGLISGISGDYFLDKPASTGRPLPTFEAKCVRADGSGCGTGEVGELWLRGATVIKGYLNQPAATAEAITDGWLHTGDIGYLDADGFLFLVDRAKDMVLRGGENVYCSEVESAIFALEGVQECAVFSVPDERLGEEVGAAVYLQPGAALDGASLRAQLQQRLAAYKIPRYVWLLDRPLPRNANGKFVKRELRDALPLEAAC